MRINKIKYYPYGLKEYFKRFAFFPKRIQDHWIWWENYYVPSVWQSKGAFNSYSWKDGEVKSSLECYWYNYLPVLPEDQDYQKWLEKKSKLHNVLK